MASDANDASTEGIFAAEKLRCDATEAGDWATLIELFSDEFIYVHNTGNVDDKAQYLELLARRPRRIERRNLVVRRYGDVAVMTGQLFMTLPEHGSLTAQSNEYNVTQVWVERGGKWELDAYQSTKPKKVHSSAP